MLESEQDYERFGIRSDADDYVVKATPAAALFARALAQTLATLGDPKAAFLALLGRLERNPDIKIQIPASYRTAIAQMPGAAFQVPSAPLATRLRARSELGRDLAPELARHDLSYDAITAEASARRAQASPADALKALSSLVEENPGDAVLARDVGFSAMDLGLHAQAFHLFRRVADARPHEPQTYRAMAQALAAMGKLDLALAYYEIPLMGQWDPRFGELRKIVELDYLRFLRGLTSGNAPSSARDYARARLDALAAQVGLGRADLVVTVTWNTDNTDVDLHVTEPSGEECFYSHRNTRSGGTLTQDVTQGYGPEMYVLRDAPKGRYDIRAHYYASDANRASARTKVYATVFENWGTKQEKVTEKVVTLETGKESHPIATIQR
jgi:tetratricopeptide (TPR) repeat protein